MMKRGIFRSGLTVFFMLQLAATVALADQAPDCLGNNGQSISVNDGQVLQWETTTPNQYLARAHVTGNVVELYPDQNGHNHFAIQIGPNSSDRLEVVYNQDFGTVPNPAVGDSVEACGDYITSTAQAGPYPPSPCSAIIHWVHASDSAKHPSGYLMINGTVYGGFPGQAPSPAQTGQPPQNDNDNGQPGYCSHRAHKRHEC